jgi:Zn2+/Cd2+-exporting ATPase
VNILKSYKFLLQNLDCANCAKKIEDKIASKPEYKEVVVNFSTLTLSFKTDKEKGVEEDIKKIVKDIEPDTVVISKDKKQIEQVQRNNKDIFRLFAGLAIYGLSVLLKQQIIISYILLVISAITLLYRTVIKAYKQLKGKILDENTLIIVSVIGACLVGKTMEGIMVITLYEIGKILEARAVNKTRKSISSLMDIKPEYANLKINEEIKQVSPEEVKIGDLIVIKTGEKIPLDGEIVSGNAKINNSALTGESRLIDSMIGDKVLSGGIVSEGLIEIKVEKTYENSTVAQILNLVENATDKKAKTETTVSKLAKIYTPVVFVLAILVAVFMPLVVKNVTYSDSIYKALTFLVISCPCSIAISVPLSYFSGIGKASKSGILVKGSDYLDGFKDIGEVIFDKTGTITTGNFSVSKIQTFNDEYSENEVLELFAIGESFSNHPIAKSIINKFEKEIDASKVKEYKEISGKGIEYKIDDRKIKIGNKNFAGEQTVNEDKTGTNLYLNVDGKTVGSIILSDEIKTDAKSAIDRLNKLGIITKMFTGDSKEIALEIAKQVGIAKVEYEMLPQDKYSKLEEEINSNKTNKKISFVGDGINDSPVLARADIGISMGGIGSSSAIEASDVVIMTDELLKITEGIQISKKTNRIIKQNLIFAIGVKILVLVLSILGVATMWQAVFADVGTTLITILNTIRILK